MENMNHDTGRQRPELSERLKLIISMVPDGACIADAGTDHGWVPVFLAIDGKIRHGIAMDIRSGPLSHAQEHIREYGVEKVIETRLSDGISELKSGEADTVIVTGMGGELLIHIMEDGKELWNSIDSWILSPQSEIWKVRTYLYENQFSVLNEKMLFEDGKYYTVICAVRKKPKKQSNTELRFGKYLMDHKDPVFSKYLESERKKVKQIIETLKKRKTEKASERLEGLEKYLMQIDEVLYEMHGNYPEA